MKNTLEIKMSMLIRYLLILEFTETEITKPPIDLL